MAPSSSPPPGPPLYLGVDGGGTGCRAVLAGPDGPVLGRGEGGPANPYGVGPEAAWTNVLVAAERAVADAGLDPSSALPRVRACVGLAGAERPPQRAALLALPHPFAALELVPDPVVALAGAIGAPEGALLIAGTGSVGYALPPGRAPARAGGWGFAAGDEGSGAWLGREAVRATLRALDGRGPETALRAAVLDAWGPSVDALVERARAASPDAWAALAPLVLSAAKDGDAVASRLADAAVAELVALLEALAHAFAPAVAPGPTDGRKRDGPPPAPPVPWSAVGGIAGALRTRLIAAAPAPFRGGFRPPAAPPVEGALLLARRAGGERP